MVDGGNLTSAIDILKFLLVPRANSGGNGNGQGMLDCYDFATVLGTMVQEKKAESAGRILFSLFSDTQAEDSQAAQTLVPFVLGTLIDQGRSEWSVELAMQLMYTTIEEIEAGSDEYDYSVTGWCLAQMVSEGCGGSCQRREGEQEGGHAELRRRRTGGTGPTSHRTRRPPPCPVTPPSCRWRQPPPLPCTRPVRLLRCGSAARTGLLACAWTCSSTQWSGTIMRR